LCYLPPRVECVLERLAEAIGEANLEVGGGLGRNCVSGVVASVVQLSLAVVQVEL